MRVSATPAATVAATLAGLRVGFIAHSPESPVRLTRAGSCEWLWRRQGLEVGDDRVDLVGFEMILEARHARRAVADEFTHDVFLPAEGGLRQGRTIMAAGRDLRLHVADHAGLGEERSEEHTSELQSLAYLVCRLLLEKKKKKQI